MADSHIRLLQCLTCKSLEEIPDYQGPASQDVLLETLVSRHRFPDGNAHLGHLHRVESKHWESPSTRAGIENQIRESSGHTGLDPAFYNAKATFQEDAMTCWQRHNRTTNCSEYRSSSKVLLPDTIGLRKEVARHTRSDDIVRSAPKQYLCTFCPMHSLVVQAKRKAAGQYN